MEKFYKKWFFPLAVPFMILFILVVLLPFVVGVFLFLYRLERHLFWVETPFSRWQVLITILILLKRKFYQRTNKHGSSVYGCCLCYSSSYIPWLCTACFQHKKRRRIFSFCVLFAKPREDRLQLYLGALFLRLFSQSFYLMRVDLSAFLSLLICCKTTTRQLSPWQLWQHGKWPVIAMIIFVTGLNNIPGDLYEAASIDGCTPLQKFKNVTLPLLMPSFTIVIFMTLANCFKMLDL